MIFVYLNQIPLNSSVIKKLISTIKRYYNIYDYDNSIDKFGFLINDEKVWVEENLNQFYLEWFINECLNSRSLKYWSIGCNSLKCLIREYGIPNELRQQMWLTFIKTKLDLTINVSLNIIICFIFIL